MELPLNEEDLALASRLAEKDLIEDFVKDIKKRLGDPKKNPALAKRLDDLFQYHISKIFNEYYSKVYRAKCKVAGCAQMSSFEFDPRNEWARKHSEKPKHRVKIWEEWVRTK